MIPENLLARLAGAYPDVLRKAGTDRVKFTAMGGVLLTTAGVAGVSAAFALNTAVGLPALAAVIAGALWALVIFNLDRMLVVSMTRQSGWLRNLLTALPRLALAAVIGFVISVPLVLRIFQPEIDGELPRLHADNLIAAQQKLDKEFADIDPLQQKVDQLQAVASGQQQAAVSADPDVKAAQQQVDAAQNAYNTAAAAAQCELVGSCGTHVPGIGEAYRQAKAEADRAAATLDVARRALDSAKQAAAGRILGSTTSSRAAAQDQLKTFLPQLESRKAARADAQAKLSSGELGSEGLLARLEALDRLAGDNPTMATANWALFLLFLFVELLPVVVKLLSMVGTPTLYDRLLVEAETAMETKATLGYSIAKTLDQDRVDKQIAAGKDANRLLVEKQTEIAATAIGVWGTIAASRSDEELQRWYEQHASPQQAATVRLPAAGAPPAAAPPPPPPVPSPRGPGPSYQQFKAQYPPHASRNGQP